MDKYNRNGGDFRIKRLSAISLAAAMAIALFTGSQFNTCVTWAGENGSSDISDQDAYVEKVLAEVEELGKTKAAIDLLKEASETVDDWRIENAYRALCNSQWKELKVKTTTPSMISTDLDYTYNEDGTVRVLKDTMYYEETGEVIGCSYTQEAFDKNGNLIETLWFEGEGPDYWYIETMEYDDAGRIIKDLAYEYGELNFDLTYEYDEKGNKTHEYMVNNNHLYDQEEQSSYTYSNNYWENEYDADDKLIKVTRIGEDGTVNRITEYIYDEAGNCVKTLYYNGDGELTKYNEQEYNKYGTSVRMFSYDAQGNGLSSWEKEYDDNNRLTKETHYMQNMEFEYSHEFTYDENGCLKTDDYKYSDENQNHFSVFEWVFFPLE